MSEHPFLAHRTVLSAWTRAVDGGMSGAEFEALVLGLDDAVKAVDGRGIVRSPTVSFAADAIGDGIAVIGKLEASSVSGSHKSRHLFGLMVGLLVDEKLAGAGAGDERAGLAIASCGNAALAAAVIARAAKWPIAVFVPPDAAESTVSRLGALGAEIVACERRPSEPGDPCVLRFREAVAAGAIAFCCQGTDNAETLDGGAVLGREFAQDLLDGDESVDHVFVQVGGGALMTGVWRGMRHTLIAAGANLPRFHAVQTLGGYPLVRAWRIAIDDVTARLAGGLAAAAVDPRFAVEAAAGKAAAHSRASIYRRMAEEPECYMWPWHNAPRSIASGILDDETYDFADCIEAMLESRGVALAVSEEALTKSRDLTESATDVPISYTGAAGLAGLLTAVELGIVRPGQRVGVILSGARR